MPLLRVPSKPGENPRAVQDQPQPQVEKERTAEVGEEQPVFGELVRQQGDQSPEERDPVDEDDREAVLHPKVEELVVDVGHIGRERAASLEQPGTHDPDGVDDRQAEDHDRQGRADRPVPPLCQMTPRNQA